MRGPTIVLLCVLMVGVEPAHATSAVQHLVPPPCPDLSQRLAYCRPDGAGVPDGRGGVFVAWSDDRGVTVQRFGPAGEVEPGWPGLGLPVGWGAGPQFSLASDGSGGALITWIGSHGEVRLQRVTSDCGIAPGWPAEGLVLCDLEGDGRFPAVARADGASAMVAWREQEMNGTESFRLARALLSGSVARDWPPDGFVLENGYVGDICELLADGRGGALVSWRRGGEPYRPEVILQRVTAGATIAAGWPAQGLLVAVQVVADGYREEPVEHPFLATDGRGGAYVVWTTSQHADPQRYDPDLWAQHITGKGTVAPGWPKDGKLVAGGEGDQRVAAVAADNGVALVSWFDDAVEDRIRLASLGATGSQTDWGVGPEALDVARIAVAPSVSGRAYVAWNSNRSDITRPSLVQWNRGEAAHPVSLPASAGSIGWDPERLGLVPDGRDGALIFWQGSSEKADPPDRWVVRVSGVSGAKIRE